MHNNNLCLLMACSSHEHHIERQGKQIKLFNFYLLTFLLTSWCIFLIVSWLKGGLLTWPNKYDRKWPCNMTENAEDCKRYFFLTLNLTKNDNCKPYDESKYAYSTQKYEKGLYMFTALRSMKKRCLYMFTVLRGRFRSYSYSS